jgi:hypothetical protein
MRRFFIAACLLSIGASATAQELPRFLELRPLIGAYVPTGAQRDYFDDAAIYGLQAAFEYRPTLHFVGSFTWSPSHNNFVAVDDAVNMFQYDVGAEFNLVRSLGAGWDLKPFLGLGVGGRTYNYDAMSLATRTFVAGYGVIGTEFQYRSVAIRLEGRDYLSDFQNPLIGGSEARNDLGFSIGLAYHIGRHDR